MRKVKVRHRPLPGIGELFKVDTASGVTVIVVSHRSGRREIAVGERGSDEPIATAALTRNEAAAVATLLTGTQIELIATTET
jgi:K+/H+ antiporter YhaU regulatory subunit KhtT